MVKRRAAHNSNDSDIETPESSSTPAKRARIEGDNNEDASSAPRVQGAKGRAKKKAVVEDEDTEEVELDARLSTNISRITADQDDDEFEAQNEALLLDAISKREKKKGVRRRI
jgi:hypothetical protein